MIRVFFNEAGYFVAGENVEISRRFSPATTTRGDRIFQPIHHTYKILYLALTELREAKIKEDVIVFNDSRIIDEINCLCPPLDEECKKWIQIIGRNVIPSIRSILIFRKKPSSLIHETISAAHKKMMPAVDKVKVSLILAEQEVQYKTRKQKSIKKLKTSWFGEQNEQR